MSTLIIVGGYALSFFLFTNWSPEMKNIDAFTHSLPYIAIVSLLYFYLTEKDIKKINTLDSFLINVTHLFFIMIVVTALVFFVRDFAFPRRIFISGFFVQLILFLLWEFFLSILMKKNSKMMNSVIICDDLTYQVLKEKVDHSEVNVMKRVEEIEDIDLGETEHILVSMNHKYINDILELANLHKIVISIIPNSNQISLFSAEVSYNSDILTMTIDPLGLNANQRFIKRVIDLGLSSFLLLITSPIIFIITLILYFSEKDVIFKQERYTINKKVFTIYKFKTINNNQVTKIGYFLRNLRLDELPQLLNILKGEMSFVGPRPEIVGLSNKYANEFPEFNNRLAVKAGLTGFAQIYGNHGTNYQDKLRLDVFYIRNYTLILDVRIILKTLSVMLSQAGTIK